MENFFLRIGCINLNQILDITNELNLSISESIELNETLSPKDFIFSVLEELDTTNVKRKNIALLKLLKALINKQNTNFHFELRLDSCFNKALLELCLEMNVLPELAKNLSIFYCKFTEMSK